MIATFHKSGFNSVLYTCDLPVLLPAVEKTEGCFEYGTPGLIAGVLYEYLKEGRAPSISPASPSSLTNLTLVVADGGGVGSVSAGGILVPVIARTAAAS